MTTIEEIDARVTASMGMTYSSGWTEGKMEARISKEDWDAVMRTVRLRVGEYTPAQHPLPTDPLWFSEVPAGQYLTLGRMAEILREAGATVQGSSSFLNAYGADGL